PNPRPGNPPLATTPPPSTYSSPRRPIKHLSLIPLALTTLQPLATDLTVSAGPHARSRSIVPFTLPQNLDRRAAYHLREGQTTLPIQTLRDGKALFILDTLKANQSRTFTLEPEKPAMAPAWLKKQANNITITVGDASLRYNGDKTPLPEGFEP